MSRSTFARCSASCVSRALRCARASVDDIGRQPEPVGDLERQAAARRAVVQPVGRRERLGIEPESRRHHALGRRRVRLQRVVVRRRDHHRAAAAEVIDDRHRERAAFDGIGAGARLVEQHQRRQRERLVHRDDVGDVRRERAQARGDRLLVADVGEDACGTPASASRRPPGSADPACAISDSSPAVLSATVLPPVFGPVMTSTRTGGISRMSTGTGSRSA